MKINKTTLVHFLNIILITAIAIVVNVFFSYRDYNLNKDNKWISTKTMAEKGVYAAWTTMFTKVTLSKNRLNLSAWHGYQEFIFKRALKFNDISFEVQSFNRPFSFILNKTDSGSAGIFFNFTGDSCRFFITDNEGRFIRQNDFYISESLNNHYWNKVSCNLYSGILHLAINGHDYLNQAANFPDSVHVGFRGGKDDVFVDDLVVNDNKPGRAVLDTFGPPIKANWQSVLVLCFGFMIYYCLFPKYAQNLVLLNSALLAGMVLYYMLYFFYFSGLYPAEVTGSNNWKGVKMNMESYDQTYKRIKKEYPLKEVKGKIPLILLVGSSQTWGAGASNFSKTFPYRVEQNLRCALGDSSILVINVGMSGARSDDLLGYYKNDWINYQPCLTVINLATNDPDTGIFKKSLKEFIDLNLSHHIKTLLVLEPNDIMSDHLSRNHAVMKEVAKANKVPFIEPQSYMDSCANSGFIWWDYVHLTDYGYGLMAAQILPAIIEAMGEDTAHVNCRRVDSTTSTSP